MKKERICTFKRIKIPFIMSIVTLMIGYFLAQSSFGIPIKTKLIILLASYLPFLLFVIITLLCYLFPDKKKRFSTFKYTKTFITISLISYYFMAIFFIGIEEAENPVTNTKYYSHYVNRASLTEVFPQKIPDNVENIQFYYAPGFLQGGTNYSLYYIDKNMTIDKFNKIYKEKAIWIGYKKEYNENEGLLAGAFSYTPADYKNKDDYMIYIVKGSCDDSGYCNHGEFLLAAYNEKTNEVIFRAKQW